MKNIQSQAIYHFERSLLGMICLMLSLIRLDDTFTYAVFNLLKSNPGADLK